MEHLCANPGQFALTSAQTGQGCGTTKRGRRGLGAAMAWQYGDKGPAGTRRKAEAETVRRAFEELRARGTVSADLVEIMIEDSWKRCRQFGLDEGQEPDFEQQSSNRLTESREQNRELALHALPVMENLYQQIVDTESMLVLTDANGLILHSLGDNSFLQRADQVALRPGVNWSERTKGTNAIGTAIITQTPTLVHGNEHFLSANHFLTCSAAPICDPHGKLIGVLDVSGDWRGYHRHTMALVRMSASVIENHLFSSAFPDQITLHFHAHPELIGTLFEGIAVFGPGGACITANKAALFQFGVALSALRGHRFAELFGVPLPAVLGSTDVRLGRCVVLTLPTGVRVFARVQPGPELSRLIIPGGDGVREAPPPAQKARGTTPERIAPPPTDTRPPLASLIALDTGDPDVAETIRRVRRVLGRGISILIQGETGTGKELLARAIHLESPRAASPFIAVNCASIPEGLIESELFGYEEGAFTGARKRGNVGKIVLAHTGTLFLDEIGDMPLALQARLLRVLQERVVTPLGSTKAQPVDVAIICATHRRLKEAIADGRFREDLYYRLNGLLVTLPALRQRTDLDQLLQRMFEDCGAEAAGLSISRDVMALFRRHRWPGNLRQLASVVRASVAMLDGSPVLRTEHLPPDFLEDLQEHEPPPVQRASQPELPSGSPGNGRATLKDVEASAIERAIRDHQGNIAAAARSLGVSRNTIYRRLVPGPNKPR
ncbi:MAG TPA: sigma-54-dependent Fis family transcriptional regulator [Burkholderiaceae bacterium]|nr:sigma-54-dependent Fis family transcriptional regulator [Burkholderiaceae bacterium]